MAGEVRLGEVRLGKVWRVKSRFGKVWQARYGASGQVRAGSGMAGAVG